MNESGRSAGRQDYWDIKLTRTLIERCHGRRQLSLAQHCLRSVNERLHHAAYHCHEAQAILVAHIDERIDHLDSYDATFSWGDWEGCTELTLPLMKIEANIIAAALSIHSIRDILSRVVYYSLALNQQAEAPRGRKVSIETVAMFLNGKDQFRDICSLLTSFAKAPELRPIAKIANHTKHHGLVESIVRVESVDGKARYSFEFGQFPGLQSRDREIEALLTPAFQRTSVAVVHTGIAINEFLIA